MTEFIGFNPPFIGGSQKILSRQDDERLIRNDVLNNLLILPNELPFRPTYGVNLRNFVFEKMDSSAIDQLKHEIISQIKSNDSRLIVRNVKLVPNADDASLEITILISMVQDPNKNIEIKRLIKILVNN